MLRFNCKDTIFLTERQANILKAALVQLPIITTAIYENYSGYEIEECAAKWLSHFESSGLLDFTDLNELDKMVLEQSLNHSQFIIDNKAKYHGGMITQGKLSGQIMVARTLENKFRRLGLTTTEIPKCA